MIITLKTTSRDTAGRFTNYYPEGLTIPPKASIGLVNMSFELAKGLTLDATNNTFQIKVGPQTTYTTITLTAATYETVQDFIDEFQIQLTAFFTAQDSHIQSLFPPADQKVTVTAADIIEINLVFEATSQDLDTWNTETDLNVYDNSVGDLLAGDTGYYLNTDPTATIDVAYVSSYDAGGAASTDDFILGAHNKTGAETNMSAKVKWVLRASPEAVADTQYVALADAYGQVVSAAAIQVVIDYTAGTFDILERRSQDDALTSILAGPAVAIVAGQELEIKIIEFAIDEEEEHLALYFVNDTAINVSTTTTDRYLIKRDANLYPIWSPAEGATINSIPTGAGTEPSGAIAGTIGGTGVTAPEISAAGTGYKIGDLLVQSGSTGTGTLAQFYVDEITAATGAVTGILAHNVGTGHAVDDVISFTAAPAGGAGCQITVKAVVSSFTNLVGGSGYASGAATISTDGGSTVAGTCTIVAVAGEVTTVTVTDGGSNWDTAATGTIKIEQPGQDDCTIDIDPDGLFNNNCQHVENLQATFTQWQDGIKPLVRENTTTLQIPAGLMEITHLNHLYRDAAMPITGNGAIQAENDRPPIIHVQVDDFQLESREGQTDTFGGVNGKTIGVVCGGSEAPTATTQEGFFFKEQFNIVYNKLENPQTNTHNELTCRLTDASNIPLTQIKHPVTIHLDLKPEII